MILAVVLQFHLSLSYYISGLIEEGKWTNCNGTALPKSRKYFWQGTFPLISETLKYLDIYLSLISKTLSENCTLLFHIQISIEPISGKKVEHNGIKVELLGQIG